jgi:hypothetical protein
MKTKMDSSRFFMQNPSPGPVPPKPNEPSTPIIPPDLPPNPGTPPEMPPLPNIPPQELPEKD